MKVTVCVGSSCFIKGSQQVVERLQALISKHQLTEKIELTGTFCMENCQRGVCVMVDDAVCSVTPESVDLFFADKILNGISADNKTCEGE